METITALARPFRPVGLHVGAARVFQLPQIAEGLRDDEGYRRSGVSAITLARDEQMTLVLVALRRGSVMGEHRSPSDGTALLLSGRGVFVSGEDERTPLEPGSLAAFGAGLPHAVEAVEDALYLVTIGGRARPHGDT